MSTYRRQHQEAAADNTSLGERVSTTSIERALDSGKFQIGQKVMVRWKGAKGEIGTLKHQSGESNYPAVIVSVREHPQHGNVYQVKIPSLNNMSVKTTAARITKAAPKPGRKLREAQSA